jgi:hypothetical protein
MDEKQLTVDYPLVDENLNVLESAAEFIKKTSDEFSNYEVLINVDDLAMVPTAVFFSLKPRRNMSIKVKLGDFKGANFVHSFLISGYVRVVIRE